MPMMWQSLIGSEKGDLRSLLSNELPGIATHAATAKTCG